MAANPRPPRPRPRALATFLSPLSSDKTCPFVSATYSLQMAGFRPGDEVLIIPLGTSSLDRRRALAQFEMTQGKRERRGRR